MKRSDKFEAAIASGLDALDEIRPGDRIFVGSGCGEPTALIEEIVERSHSGRLPRCELFMMFGGSAGRLQSAASPNHRVVTITATPTSGGDYFPWTIYETSRLLQNGRLRFEVALVQTSTPDDSDQVSLGISVDFACDAVSHARIAVAEVNSQMPHTRGENRVDVARFDGIVEVNRSLLEKPSPDSSTSSREIARHVAHLVPDGGTIEVGVGRVMSDVLRALHDHNDLGLHTGLFVNEMADLMKSGVITNAAKAELKGISTANQARGTRSLYDFLDGNPAVHMMPARFTHDPEILSSLPRFHAINSALEVDLLGRVNSEIRGERRVSSTGGLGDFVRAAMAARDGRSIIALNATGSGGGSRVVADLTGPASVTITADLADTVVTEFGIAELRGLMPAERAEALIAIAHPDHRDELRSAVRLSYPTRPADS